MKAVILAAGYGRRMRPLTDSQHKTLLKIGDETIIERIVNGLNDNGINEIVVVTGYMRDELIDFLSKRFPTVDFTFTHNEVYETTNNIYSMALAFSAIDIDQDIMLLEADLIFEPQVLEALIADPRDNVALVDRYQRGMDGTVVAVENGVITSVIPPHLQPPNFDFSDKYKTLNIYKFSQEFVANEFQRLLTFYADAIDDNCYYELVLGILIYMQREQIFALEVDDGRWAEVDDPNDLGLAAFVFEEDRQVEVLNHAFGGFWNYDVIDYCFIRNMYFPSGSVLSELRNNLDELLWNYGSRQSILNQKLAYFLLCHRDRVVALNGAAQVYPVLRHLFTDKRVLVPDPTFGEYERTFPNAQTYPDNGATALESLEQVIANSTFDVVVIVNPNNPTGSVLQTPKIFELAAAHPQTTIIVDESFIEFSDTASICETLEEHPLDNVLVLKSLSKSLGVPGIRLGYAYTCDHLLRQQILDEIPIWNMNSIAENFLEILLKYRDELDRSFDLTMRDRQDFAAELEASRFVHRVLGSGGNFLTCELTVNAGDLGRVQERLLRDHQVFVKDVSDKFADGKGYVRLAVRLPAENSEIVRLLDNGLLSASQDASII